MFRQIFFRTPLSVYLVAIILPSAMLIASLLTGVPHRVLLRDPISAADGGPADEFPQGLYGLFSHLGVLGLCVAATICFYTYFASSHVSPHTRFFLLYAGVFSAVLTLDDALMIHESVAVPFYIGYALAAVLYLYCFAGLIFKRLDALLLLICMGLLGTSVITDTVVDLVTAGSLEGEPVLRASIEATGMPEMVEATGGQFRLRALAEVIEDGAKFVGISCWATFHVRAVWLLRHDP